MTLLDRATSRGWPVAWLALVLPLAWWAVSYAAAGWIPHGDTAHTAVRAHDVFSAHSPWLGMPSTSGFVAPGVNAHHPGPLQFQLLAPLHALSGHAPWGLLLATLVVNAALLACALAGAAAAAGTRGWVTVTGVQWVFIALYGSALAEPWNPWIAAFAAAAAISAAWAVLVGNGSWWPVFIVSASVAAQSHLALAPLMLVMGVVTLVASVLLVRARRLVLSARTAGLTAVLGVLCWTAPLLDVARREPDNLDLMLSVASAGGGGTVLGLVIAAVTVGLLWSAHRRGRGLLTGSPQAIVAWLLVATGVLVWSATRAGEGRAGYAGWGAVVPLTLLMWWLVGAAMRARRRRGIARAVVALGAMALVLMPHPLGDSFRDHGVSAGDVVDRALTAVADHDGPIEVQTAGGLAWADLGPALYAALVTEGREVWFDPRVDGEREDDFRHARWATGPRLRLVVNSHAGTPEPVPETAVVHRIELPERPGISDPDRQVDLVLTLVE